MSSSTWAQMIKMDIMDIKSRLEVLEAKLGTAPEGTTGLGDREISTAGEEDKVTPSTAMDLMQATYTIRTATIAMRGYLMLLDQAGLSKDQKKMIREMEYSMMMILKMANTIRLLMLAQKAYEAATLGPLGIPMFAYYGVFAGGFVASSLAYGSKVEGGMV